MSRKRERILHTNQAFTLLEILFVLLIIGFLAAASLRRWDAMVDEYGRLVINAAVAELNAREKFTWAKAVVSKEGWQNDAALFSNLDITMGKDYTWVEKGATLEGGRISFQDRFVFDLTRLPSTKQTPAMWKSHEP